MSRAGLCRITNLSSESGHWTARVSLDGETVPVDRQFGSWQYQVPGSTMRKDVVPVVAAALQARVRTEERRVSRSSK